MKKLPIHPLAELLPPMTPAEFSALKEDVFRNGQREPAVLLDGKVLDGRHRQEACAEIGKPLKTVKYDPAWGNPAWFVYSKAVHRNLTDSQKAAAAVGLLDELARDSRQRSAANLVQNARGGNPAPSGNGHSREAAASLFGVSGRYVQEAAFIRKQDRRLFDQVLRGALTLPRAKRDLNRRHKRQLLKKAAAAAPHVGEWEVRVADCIEGLDTIPRGGARLIFADPPYNIGVDYGHGRSADRLPAHVYLEWCNQWVLACAEALAEDGSLFILINDVWADAIGAMVTRQANGLHRRNWIIWHETFGVYQADNFASCARHLFYCVKDPERCIFHAHAVTEPSLRQTVYRDKRANPNGRTLGNVWQIPRLVDNAAERVPGFPTQLPVALVRRVVECCTDPGDLVVDPFNGSGTTGEAAIRTGRRYLGFDVSRRYVARSDTRLRAVAAELAKTMKA